MSYLSDECIAVNPLLNPQRAYLLQAHLRGGGVLIETGGLFEMAVGV